MAPIHISKDPSDKTPVACVYAPLTRCIVLDWFGQNSKYFGSGQEIRVMSPEFPYPELPSIWGLGLKLVYQGNVYHL